ncbi:hypothetical protein Echvi_1184 [Echinicola vietnamensis DSM 17526]|uniref:Uncharacterized protein n=1 Tax=Echinicola vietnamensis (strain DSM 17526 / LMG 23754 / KMM 6221) TaxID=926556 RepID=L0FXS5_ECHVK|nr:hypothetical protein Echvi_1184 [Echinicola vietnamensis DSM 17526]
MKTIISLVALLLLATLRGRVLAQENPKKWDHLKSQLHSLQ